MRKIAVILPILVLVFLWTYTAPAQQQPMPSRSAKLDAVSTGEVTFEVGQPSGGQVPVTWKLDLTNSDTKDHTVDVQVRFLDAQGAELFHDLVMRSKVPAKGTLTVNNTATVDAAKAQNIKGTQTQVRARR